MLFPLEVVPIHLKKPKQWIERQKTAVLICIWIEVSEETLLHSERPKLYTTVAFFSAIELKSFFPF